MLFLDMQRPNIMRQVKYRRPKLMVVYNLNFFKSDYHGRLSLFTPEYQMTWPQHIVQQNYISIVPPSPITFSDKISKTILRPKIFACTLNPQSKYCLTNTIVLYYCFCSQIISSFLLKNNSIKNNIQKSESDETIWGLKATFNHRKRVKTTTI